ncbi:MAG: hypothetical protein KC996_07150 [Phycisphaerales bacterium]|nr:hypothetical protein [Phycisphaerales bacterium]
MKTTRMLCVLGWAIVASASHAGIIHDDFEQYQSGQLPSGQWHDVFDRVVNHPPSQPSINVISTVDAHGNATQAVQTVREGGTNGFYASIEDSNIHNLSMDVRVDAMPSANTGWPVGVGYLGYSEGDVNANPQAILYAWTGRVWNFFIAMGEGRPAVDLRLSGPRFQIGTWYTLSVEVNTETGEFQARVYDAATGELTNSTNHIYNNWDPEVDRFNTITMFDGDNPGAAAHGQSTIDNVHYTPTPSSLAMVPVMLSVAIRRRR